MDDSSNMHFNSARTPGQVAVIVSILAAKQCVEQLLIEKLSRRVWTSGVRNDIAMSPQSQIPDGEKQWESVHLCPKCGQPLNLENIDLEAATTGIATCPKCDWSSPINLKIVSEDKAP